MNLILSPNIAFTTSLVGRNFILASNTWNIVFFPSHWWVEMKFMLKMWLLSSTLVGRNLIFPPNVAFLFTLVGRKNHTGGKKYVSIRYIRGKIWKLGSPGLYSHIGNNNYRPFPYWVRFHQSIIGRKGMVVALSKLEGHVHLILPLYMYTSKMWTSLSL